MKRLMIFKMNMMLAVVMTVMSIINMNDDQYDEDVMMPSSMIMMAIAVAFVFKLPCVCVADGGRVLLCCLGA